MKGVRDVSDQYIKCVCGVPLNKAFEHKWEQRKIKGKLFKELYIEKSRHRCMVCGKIVEYNKGMIKDNEARK